MKHILIILALLCLLAAAPAMAVEFTDANGRTVSVDQPQRVVSLYNSYGDAWLLSGGSLVGTIDDTFDIADSTQTAEVQNLGKHNAPNMELLFALEPDFVLLSADVAAHVEIGATLERAGIPCAYFSTPDWRSYMENIRLFTQITGQEALYEQQVRTVQQPIEALIAEASAGEGYGKTTALLLRAYSNNVRAKNSETTVAGNLLRDMGFVNLADGDSPLAENLSMEAILIADPDYIFVVPVGSDTEAALRSFDSMLVSNPAWGTLTAVREDRCILLDRALFHYHPNERWAEAYAFIADLIREAAP